MKKILSVVHRSTKVTFALGEALVVFLLVVSTVFYFGAGRIFDYHFAIDVSEKLLESVRPLSVLVGVGSLGLEYYLRQKSPD